jgi:hypothetical protein
MLKMEIINMYRWLSCEITQGQFTGEYAVRAQMFDNTEFSLFVPKDCLKFNEEPTLDKSVNGMISVLVADQKDDLVLVNLPRPTFENGRSITVKQSQLVHTK